MFDILELLVMAHKPHSLLFALPVLASFALCLQPCLAQPDVDPRHPEWVELPLSDVWFNDSLIRGEIISAHYYGAGGLGDIDNSGIDDFAVALSIAKKDSSGATIVNNGLAIYKGIPNGFPDIHDYQWISPTEFASNTKLLAVGDWDGDNDKDVCTDIRLFGDTSNGTSGSEIHRIVIFWNDGDGNFSLNDTTRLPNPAGLGGDVWYGRYGRSFDVSGDGVEDLMINGGGAFVDGKYVATASMFQFNGVSGGQWGRKSVSAAPVWGWWNVPVHHRMSILDQNCDDWPDLIFYNDGPWSNEDDLIICYSNEGGIPDTLDMEHFSFVNLCGDRTFALLQDMTSDRVPDLILTCHDWKWHVYAGLPGKRLSEVYGTGNDPADPENGFPDARPWAKVEMAGLLRPEFGSPYEGPLYDLGDADMDGWNDLWTLFSSLEDGPNVVAYRAGPGFDPIIDAHAYFGGEIIQVGVLGDIDGTRNSTRVLINGVGQHEVIQFFKGSKDLPTTAYDYPRKPPSGHKLLEVTENRCTSSVGVASDELRLARASLGLHVVPNPSSGDVRIKWDSKKSSGEETVIAIHDLSGREIYRMATSTEDGEAVWAAENIPHGIYYITLTIGGRTETVQTMIE